jgi:hypothetical protein
MTWENPILVLTQTPIIGNVNEDPVAIAFIGSAFMNTTEDNIQNLYKQNMKKEARIGELEKKLQ